MITIIIHGIYLLPFDMKITIIVIEITSLSYYINESCSNNSKINSEKDCGRFSDLQESRIMCNDRICLLPVKLTHV